MTSVDAEKLFFDPERYERVGADGRTNEAFAGVLGSVLENSVLRLRELREVDGWGDLVDLVYQLELFLFEMKLMEGVAAKQPAGSFAQKVAYAKVVHILYEFVKSLDGWFGDVIVDMAKSVKVEFSKEELRALMRKRNDSFKRIRKWKDLRNMATAHRHHDSRASMEELSKVDPSEVRWAASQMYAFLLDVAQSIPSDPKGEV